MPDALSAYREQGWTVFDPEPAMADWANACAPVGQRLASDPKLNHWWRCAGTWFAGVNVLPNAPDGSVKDEGIPPLSGTAIAFIRDALGQPVDAFDAAQISVVTPGYPTRGDEETEAAHRYRTHRCAAHVDGLERIMPERRRKLSETHGFLLGIPLSDATVEQGAFVVWEGSHEIMRAAFKSRLHGIASEDWRSVDITDAYTDARKRVFDTCKAVEIAPGLGGAYVVHPLALHGVAPWRGPEGPPRAVAYFRPDTLGGDPQKWLDQ